ncbi:MAG: hypothetical protein QE271_07390 [Bacteriovoracaceae bacterium]|nr:hypothetical protein [Bacteriovoracaceae bacterium]
MKTFFYFNLFVSLLVSDLIHAQLNDASYHSIVLLDEIGNYTANYIKTLNANQIPACQVDIPTETLETRKDWTGFKDYIRSICITDLNNRFYDFRNTNKALDDDLLTEYPRFYPGSKLEQYILKENSTGETFTRGFYQACECPI